jgi:protein required for attachment to host cells
MVSYPRTPSSRTGHPRGFIALGGRELHPSWCAASTIRRGRLKAREIDSDRRGRDFASGGGRHAFSHEESPTEHVARELAIHLASDLDRARANGEFDEVALIAPPRMLGCLRDALSAPTRELVYAELAKDIEQLDAMDLRKHLDQFARA